MLRAAKVLIKANSHFKQKLSALDTFAVVKKYPELKLAWKSTTGG